MSKDKENSKALQNLEAYRKFNERFDKLKEECRRKDSVQYTSELNRIVTMEELTETAAYNRVRNRKRKERRKKKKSFLANAPI